jgi:hypothetical protein
METGGWIFIVLSWVIIIGLFIFCFKRILGQGKNGEKRADGESKI